MKHSTGTVMLLLGAVVLCTTVSPVEMLGAFQVIALAPTPTLRAVTKTEAPGQDLTKTSEVTKPLYKDFYSKTAVNVAPVVSTVLYQETDYSTVLNETWETQTLGFPTTVNQSTLVLKTSIITTPTPTLSYDEFEWPTETRTFTTALNMTTTTVVENTLPFV